MSTSSEKKARYRVPAVEKAVAILEALARSDKPLGLAACSTSLQIPKATVFLLLATLEHHQLITRTDGGGYVIGPRLYELGNAYTGTLSIVSVAQPHLAELMARTKLTTNLAILDGGKVLIVDRLEAPAFIRFWTYPGLHLPIHASALGKAMAAYLPPLELEHILALHGMPRLTEKTMTNFETFSQALEGIRARGYAIEDEEGELSVGCIGAPVFDPMGRVAGAVSITSLISQLPPWPAAELGDMVRQTADRISLGLGGRPIGLPARSGATTTLEAR